jgi:sulfatase modifying factor 1
MISWVGIPAGSYQVGATELIDNPRRMVTLASFEVSKYEVTNQQFYDFVQATGYLTDAERDRNARAFQPGLKEFRWLADKTANWHFPNGQSRGGIRGKMNHPVTCISFRDALAYCVWAGVRLPTLDEWEVAARGGTDGRYFCDYPSIGEYANYWRGRNHLRADVSDGFMTTAPVGTFKPNPFGLYDVYGNVFEFCAGRLRSDTHETQRHSRGGSWWCSKNSCCFFNSVDIGTVNVKASFSNQGFRVARSVP